MIPMSSILLGLLSLLPVLQGQGLDGVLARRSLEGARVAVAVVDTATGTSLYMRNADAPMIPASNMKLLTTAAAVRLLGVDHVFVTRITATALPDPAGLVQGDLVLRGGGDPCLRADVLGPDGIHDPAGFLVDLLQTAGLRRATGSLLVDDGYLDREWVHPDWEPGDLVRSWASPVGALSLERSCLQILVDGRQSGAGPTVVMRRAVQGYRLDNEVEWSSVRGRNQVGALQPDDHGMVKVQGHIGHGVVGSPFDVPARDASLFFGRSIMARLDERGIVIEQGFDRDRTPAPDGVELMRFETPLDRAVIVANKESDNSICDHLFKVIGAEREGQGSFAAGGRALSGFLTAEVGVDVGGFVLSDGSGLARSNRVSAMSLARTVASMVRDPGPERDLYLRSLPVAGLDGTLDERLVDPPYRGAVRAKTGYIQGVSSLSGLAWTRSGRVLAFSILVNGFGAPYSNLDMKAAQDDLCRELIDRW